MQNLESKNEKVNLMQKGNKDFKWLNGMTIDVLGGKMQLGRSVVPFGKGDS